MCSYTPPQTDCTYYLSTYVLHVLPDTVSEVLRLFYIVSRSRCTCACIESVLDDACIDFDKAAFPVDNAIPKQQSDSNILGNVKNMPHMLRFCKIIFHRITKEGFLLDITLRFAEPKREQCCNDTSFRVGVPHGSFTNLFIKTLYLVKLAHVIIYVVTMALSTRAKSTAKEPY